MANFSYVLTDPQLPQAAINTLYFALLALIFGFPVPLFLAVFISELRSTGWLYNVLSYLPAVVPPVAAILLWKFFYDPSWLRRLQHRPGLVRDRAVRLAELVEPGDAGDRAGGDLGRCRGDRRSSTWPR